MPLFVDNDLRVEVSDLKDENGDIVTGATAEATLYEADETTEVSGVTWPLTLSDEGSGTYGTTLPASVGVVLGRHYWMLVSAVKSGKKATWWSQETAKRRTFNQ